MERETPGAGSFAPAGMADMDMASLANDALFRALGTSEKGLAPAEAARRLARYGSNEFAAKKKLRPAILFLSKFKNPLLILLVAAAFISGALGSRFEAGVILAIVLVSALIDFANTYRSAKAAEELTEQVRITAAVMRGGELKERSVREVVPGDVFMLEAGDLVPADGILIGAKDLFVNESALTGESLPVEKDAAPAGAPAAGTPAAGTFAAGMSAASAARKVFLGTSVVSGKGMAVAAATGARTNMGAIADKLRRPEAPTEFEKNLKDFSLFIFRTTLLLVLAVILLNIFFIKHDPLEIFLFAVAIAVGLTPELLPLIVTSNLAKGAIRMSKDGVIVKRLAALHNFGSIDVLCTDKTGTLTEDRITLVKFVDAGGRESGEVFFWGYLSSRHLTGVRGVLDQAVEAYRRLDVGAWEKVDEIPFDAVRRLESVVVRKATDDGNGEAKAGETVLIAKGAPEEILKNTDDFAGEGIVAAAARETALKEYEKLSADGFRVLGVATKKVPAKAAYGKEEERNLTFQGFLAFLDPPKRTVKDTLKKMADHHVAIKVVTGDNFLVTKKIAEEIGLPVKGALAGDEVAALGAHELARKVEECNVFTRVTPDQKELIIRALRANGHVAAYLGDGVNDVLSLKAADVGISVQNAVDIAKDTADIILLRKGLREVIDGVVEGRKTFANTFKYLMMALSSNFGNMFSMPIASLFLPFLPMTAPQILLNNFFYDSSQLAIPFDNVEKEFLARPKKFDIRFMKKFMVIFGPLSSCFDFLTFAVLLWVLRAATGGFQTGWFLESIATQTFVVLIIRNRGGFWKTPPSAALAAAAAAAVAAAWLVPYFFFGRLLGFVALGPFALLLIAAIVVLYLVAVELAKGAFYRRYGNLIEK